MKGCLLLSQLVHVGTECEREYTLGMIQCHHSFEESFTVCRAVHYRSLVPERIVSREDTNHLLPHSVKSAILLFSIRGETNDETASRKALLYASSQDMKWVVGIGTYE
jgi:hypothetical protein